MDDRVLPRSAAASPAPAGDNRRCHSLSLSLSLSLCTGRCPDAALQSRRGRSATQPSTRWSLLTSARLRQEAVARRARDSAAHRRDTAQPRTASLPETLQPHLPSHRSSSARTRRCAARLGFHTTVRQRPRPAVSHERPPPEQGSRCTAAPPH